MSRTVPAFADLPDQLDDAVTAIAALDGAAFSDLISENVYHDAPARLWEVLADPRLAQRTKAALGKHHADLLAQYAEKNTALSQVRADCLRMGYAGRQAWADAQAGLADWKRRAGVRRRAIERRIADIKTALAAHATQPRERQRAIAAADPEGAKRFRQQAQRALEELARAVLAHRNAVTSGDGSEDDDDDLWGHLETITMAMKDGRDLPLTEWLEHLDDLRANDDGPR